MKLRILKAKSKRKFAPLAWIIRKNQKTDWNHYAMEFGGKVTDAKRKGIRVLSFELWEKKYKAVETIEIELPITDAEFVTYVDSKIGTKYAFWQLVGIGLISCGILKTNPFGKNKKYLVCHEYVAVTLARFLKIEIGDSDDYTFKKVDELIEQARLLNVKNQK